jgi:hypothetical protein
LRRIRLTQRKQSYVSSLTPKLRLPQKVENCGEGFFENFQISLHRKV